MAENKTTKNAASVKAFIGKVKDQTRQADCLRILKLVEQQTGMKPAMWGSAIVGFGSYHYKYDSGREGDMPLVAFSPRASSIALYLSANFDKREALLGKFGKHRAEKGCIHIKSLADVDTKVLETMIANHIKHVRKLYPQ